MRKIVWMRVAWIILLQAAVLGGLVYALPDSTVKRHFTSTAAKQPPALTETQKLQIQNAVQRVQIAQLQMQAAQAELQKAATEAQTLFKAFTVEGYDLNLQTLEYVKKEAK